MAPKKIKNYMMGNAGDIVKHGLLAEFVEWRLADDESMHLRERHGGALQVVDAFAGCPSDNLCNLQITERVKALSDTALGRAQKRINEKMYYGSALLMREAAKNCKCEARIEVSDNDLDAHCNWRSAKAIYDSIEWINLPKDGKNVQDNDGYRILSEDQNPGAYDLILIDPYSKFLPGEFHKRNGKRFLRILELTKEHPGLFVAVFVLDRNRNNDVGRDFSAFKRDKLSDCAFSLRCPKILNSAISGESSCDSEILLISQQIQKGNCGQLRERLARFADSASKALGSTVEFWGRE